MWGRLPPPVGGVTRSVEALTAVLRAAGFTVRSVDLTRKAPAIRAVLLARVRPAYVSIYHIASFRRITQLAVLSKLEGSGHRVAFLHGGTIRDQWHDASSRSRRRTIRLLGVFDTIWVTNRLSAEWLADQGLPLPHVVSPAVEADCVPARDLTPPTPTQILVAAYNAAPLYGLDTALQSIEKMRLIGHDVMLHVLIYGEGSLQPRASFRRMASQYDWVSIHEDLDPEAVTRLLDRVDVLLRPTTNDGDSLLVREALCRGVRVIASDAVPRPYGVELASLMPDAIVEALLKGGRISSGEGLGPAADGAFMELFRTLGAREGSLG